MKSRKRSNARRTPTSTLCIDGLLTVENAETWRLRLSQSIAQTDVMTVELSGVTQIDTLGLQLLCAARKSAGQRGITFLITGRTDALDEACAAVGLDPTFPAQTGDNHP